MNRHVFDSNGGLQIKRKIDEGYVRYLPPAEEVGLITVKMPLAYVDAATWQIINQTYFRVCPGIALAIDTADMDTATLADALSYLPDLKSLSLNMNSAVDLSKLGSVNTLEKLSVSGLKADLHGVGTFKGLKSISVVGSVRNIPEISQLHALERVSFLSVRIDGFTSLHGLERLKDVTIRFGDILSIDGLKQVPSLERLHIVRAKISDPNKLKVLSRLSRLHTLILDQLTDIRQLDFLNGASLKHLMIGELPRLESLAPLKNLPRLETLGVLRLSDNKVEEIVQIRQLKQLDLPLWDYDRYARKIQDRCPNLKVTSELHIPA